jgi:Na+-translocating ferredoxin:NAD+ oxidoreductase subunit B
MTQTVYEQLARHLDDLPAGYPATESGVELRILRRLFTPETPSSPCTDRLA